MNSDRTWDAVADTVEFTIQLELARFESVVPRDARVLDFGCGYGRNLAQLCATGYSNVRGCDPSVRMIDRGRRTYPAVALQHVPELPVPDPDASYDAVLCCAVLTAIPEPDERRRAIAEIWRLLSVGGILYVVEFLKAADRQYTAEGTFQSVLGPGMKHFEKEELLGEIGLLGLIDAWECEDVDLRQKTARVVHGLWRKTPASQ